MKEHDTLRLEFGVERITNGFLVSYEFIGSSWRRDSVIEGKIVCQNKKEIIDQIDEKMAQAMKTAQL